MTATPAPLSPGRLLAFGLPALPLAALMLPLYVYLPAYYAEDLGLGFATVGGILLLARLSDVASDPLIGFLSDRWRNRFGRRRIWMLAGAPLVLVAAHELFLAGPGTSVSHLLWWTGAAYLGGTMVLLPYSAWGAELSPDYHERSRIAGWREAFAVAGTLLAAGIPGLAGAERRDALEVIAWGLWVVLPVSLLAAAWAVPEPPTRAGRSPGWRTGLRILLRNRPFRRLLAAYFVNGIANGLPASLYLVFVTHVLERPEWSGPLLFAYFFCAIAGIPLWLRLSARHGKHRVWTAAMLWAAAVFALVPLLGPGDEAWFLLICIATGVSLGADMTLPAAMQADVVDLDTLRGGQGRAGVYFALWGMATKLALACAVGLAFPLLELAGFRDAAERQPETALLALSALYALVPALIKLGAIVLMRGYPITAARQRRIQRLIAARQV